MMEESPQRPDPDALLARLENEAVQAQRGKLKIFFGASPGVGKTYAMLSAAGGLAGQGTDLVVGIAETHGRSETAELLDGLEILPPKIIDYKGHQLREFDLDAALARAPKLILVDELAHSNAPGSRHPKRWQDVEELLAAGIDVYTTVNVQHLESLNDIIGGITSIQVRETLPDHVFDDADEIVLVDLPHEELLQRLQEGKVYLPHQAERAVRNFFRKGNLLALRELALRRTADRVDDDVRAYRREKSVDTVWPTKESLLVCIGTGVGNSRLVRAGARLAAQFGVPWHAVYIETPKLERLPGAERGRILRTLKLAQDLGAITASLPGDDPVALAVAYAREHNLGKVIVGRRTARPWPWQRTYAERLGCSAPELEVITIAKDAAEPRHSDGLTSLFSAGNGRDVRWSNYAWVTAGVALVALVATYVFPFLAPANIIMIFLLFAVFAAYRFGRGPGAFAAVLSVAAFDLFFVPPYFSFNVGDVQFLLTFVIMLIVTLLIGQLTARLRFQADIALNREHRMRALFEMAKELSSALTAEQIAEISQRFVQRVFGTPSVVFALDASDALQPIGDAAGQTLPTEPDMGIAHYALDHNEAAGCSTTTLPSAPALYQPLKAPMRTRGVLVLFPPGGQWAVVPEHQRLLDTSASLIAIALERVHFITVAQDAMVRMESEQLRNSLLSVLSHDLRTPLTVMSGLAESLNLVGPPMPREQAEIAQAIHEEAVRTSALVNNLLDMARLQSGKVRIHQEWQPLEEIIGAAVQSRAAMLAGHTIDIRLPADLPMLYFDPVLMERVFCNLLENAAKYTPAGSTVTLSAQRYGDTVEIVVEDNGPGLPEGRKEALFKKFSRGQGESVTSGVGLAIVRAIVEAHQGTIKAENRPDGGARFIIRLPAGQAPEVPEEESER